MSPRLLDLADDRDPIRRRRLGRRLESALHAVTQQPTPPARLTNGSRTIRVCYHRGGWWWRCPSCRLLIRDIERAAHVELAAETHLLCRHEGGR